MVSIIVTHKKGVNYLRDCLDSIAEQNYKNFETILIDDSEEDLSEIVNEYKEKTNLKLYKLEGKTGVSAARNMGLDKAEGEYVYFLDNDDYVCETAISELVEAMTSEDDLTYGHISHTWFQRKAYNEDQGDKDEDKEDDDQKIEYDFNNILDYRFIRYRKLKGITVLSVLYRKSFLDDNGIRFDENQLYYADAPFWTDVLYHLKSYKACEASNYVKRYHNDKHGNPSVNQIVDDDREKYYIESYKFAIINARDNKILKYHIQTIICVYFIRFYAPRFRWSKEEKWEKECLVPFKEEIEKVSNKVIRQFSFYRRRLLRALRQGDIKGVKRATNMVMFNKKIGKVVKDKMQFYRAINLHVFGRTSVKDNWITFESFVGRNCSGQPKYIYQYMLETYGDKYKYIWIVDKKSVKVDGKCTKVKRFSLRYFYYMTRSKYWVINMRQPVWLPKKEEQIILSTWHGTPLKRLVFDMDDVHAANPRYKNIVYRQTRDWDYLLSDNPFSTEKFQSCFRFEKEKILEAGYPANDPMYAPNRDEMAAKIKAGLGIPKDKKVILYAPTWRDDSYYDAGEYKFELALDIERLNKEFGDEYVLLLRMHYWIVDKLDLSQFSGFTYNVSSYNDITDLYLISDICMTDYSSVFFDYANLKRPILYYTYDLEKYRDVLRGFYLDVEKDLPGPLLLTNDEVVDAIRNIDKVTEQYKDKYETFYNRFCCVDDGHAAQRVVETVFEGKKGLS